MPGGVPSRPGVVKSSSAHRSARRFSTGVPVDTDSDSVPDYRDLDTDNDGIADLHEGGSDCADANDDGICDGDDVDRLEHPVDALGRLGAGREGWTKGLLRREPPGGAEFIGEPPR